ncbi:MAG: hypothetical protein IJU40_08145 [Desulfovibrionaceae bacterium]|nr:hypothetical protein [Desulfovibrionaceae bacterium]
MEIHVNNSPNMSGLQGCGDGMCRLNSKPSTEDVDLFNQLMQGECSNNLNQAQNTADISSLFSQNFEIMASEQVNK